MYSRWAGTTENSGGAGDQYNHQYSDLLLGGSHPGMPHNLQQQQRQVQQHQQQQQPGLGGQSQQQSGAPLTPQELAVASASIRHQQAAAAAAAQYALGQSAATSVASRLLYGPTAAETALLRHRQATAMAQRQNVQRAAAAELSALETSLQRKREEQEKEKRDQQVPKGHGKKNKGRAMENKKNTGPQEIIEIDDSSDDEAQPSSVATKTSLSSSNRGSQSQSQSRLDHRSSPAGSPVGVVRPKRARAKQKLMAASPKQSADDSPQGSNKKRLRTVLRTTASEQPVVVVQNWSREGLMEELAKNEVDRVQAMLQLVLFHATGHSAATAPKDAPFPPDKVELSITQLHELAKEVVKVQLEDLQKAVDATFFKCSGYVHEMLPAANATTNANATPKAVVEAPERSAPLDVPNPIAGVLTAAVTTPRADPSVARILDVAPTTTTTTTPKDYSTSANAVATHAVAASVVSIQAKDGKITQQEREITKLKLDLDAMVQDRTKLMDSFRTEQSYLKDQVARSKTIHVRSVRAYMRASVDSLRHLRETMDMDSEEDETEVQVHGNGSQERVVERDDQ
jgi:hypothetical protein